MPARFRSRSTVVVSGTARTANGSGTVWNSTATKSEECNDIVGNYGGENPLIIASVRSMLFVRNGVDRNAFINDAKRYSSFPCVGYSAPGGWRTGSVPAGLGASKPRPSENVQVSTALMITNPNRPQVDWNQFLFEFREIPKAIYEFGKEIMSRGARNFTHSGVDLREVPIKSADQFLAFQFGLLPFVRDVQGMLDFKKNVEKKLNELQHLRARGKSSRQATVYSDNIVGAETFTYLTGLYQEASAIYYRLAGHRRNWVSTSWVLQNPLPNNDKALMDIAERAAYAEDVSMATLWELMPWSWLIDWFSNLGDIISQTRNTIPVSHAGTCIMQNTQIRVHSWRWAPGYHPGNDSLVAIDGPCQEYKTRVPSQGISPIPEFSLPLLSGGQLSILSALSVVKTGRV